MRKQTTKQKIVEKTNKPKIKRRTPQQIWTDDLKKALKKSIPYDVFWDYQDLVDRQGYTEEQMWEEFFFDFDIQLCPDSNNMVVGFYSTNNYRTKWEMLESLEIEANERHQQNWWEGILDEDNFCDLCSGDDPEYLEIMSVANFISCLNWECCEILWPNMKKEDY